MATFSNQASLTYNGNVINSNVVTGEINEILNVTKTALNECYYANDGGTAYVITLTNTGTTPITGVTVTDNLGAYTLGTQTLTPLTYDEDTTRFFVNGVLQATPTVTSGATGLVFSDITIPADSNAMLIYRASANELAPLAAGSTITNTATVTGTGVLNDATATDILGICPGPRLEITKAVSPAVVDDNGQLTYTLTLLNYGNTAITTADDVVITDQFDPVLDNIVVRYNNTTTWAAPANYTYTAGLFQTQPNQIEVPAATNTQDPTTGVWTTTPGTAVITITGTV